MDNDVLAGIHRWMVGISLTLANHHPESEGLYRAGPYMLELAVIEYAVLKMLALFRGLFRPHTKAYVEHDADIFQGPGGKWHRRTFDKYGKEVGTELTDPPNKERHFERQAAGFFKRQA